LSFVTNTSPTPDEQRFCILCIGLTIFDLRVCLLQKHPVLFAAAFTERLAAVDGEREGATRVRQGEARLFDLNAACLVGFAIPE